MASRGVDMPRRPAGPARRQVLGQRYERLPRPGLQGQGRSDARASNSIEGNEGASFTRLFVACYSLIAGPSGPAACPEINYGAAVVAGIYVAATRGLCSRDAANAVLPTGNSAASGGRRAAVAGRARRNATRDALGHLFRQCAARCRPCEAERRSSPCRGLRARIAVTDVEAGAAAAMPWSRAPISGQFGYFRAVRRNGRPGAVRRVGTGWRVLR